MLNYLALQGNTLKVFGGAREKFLFVEVRYQYIMVARLKGIYIATSIVLSIFFNANTQVSVLDTIHQEIGAFNGLCYC